MSWIMAMIKTAVNVAVKGGRVLDTDREVDKSLP